VDDAIDITINVKHFIKKMKLVASIHENVLLKVEQAQKKFKKKLMSQEKESKHLKDLFLDI
jgi:hypothetical protein